MERPEWIKCIALRPGATTTLCGRDGSLEFLFQDITHVRASDAYGSRLQACPECMKAATTIRGCRSHTTMSIW